MKNHVLIEKKKECTNCELRLVLRFIRLSDGQIKAKKKKIGSSLCPFHIYEVIFSSVYHIE